jgi:ABC-type nitrate/sulfonate/bicarbonate transport system permease component
MVSSASPARTPLPPFRRRRRLRQRPVLARTGIIILLLLIWEAGARLFGDPMFICPPSALLQGWSEIFSDPKVVRAFEITFGEVAGAFCLSVLIGLSLGLWVGLHRFSHRSVFPIVLLLYSIPQVTILPLFILYFGIGPASKIAFGVSHGMFPMIVTVVAGVQNVDLVLLKAARSMGANRRQILRWVVFPHLVPSFFTGMRLGMTAVLLGVLLAELYVSIAGVGYYAVQYTQSFRPAKLFALVSVLAAMAIMLNEIVRRAENHFSRWRA